MHNLCDYLTHQCVFFCFFLNNIESYDLRFTILIRLYCAINFKSENRTRKRAYRQLWELRQIRRSMSCTYSISFPFVLYSSLVIFTILTCKPMLIEFVLNLATLIDSNNFQSSWSKFQSPQFFIFFEKSGYDPQYLLWSGIIN